MTRSATGVNFVASAYLRLESLNLDGVAELVGLDPAKSSVARKLLIAAWHMLSRDEPFKPPAPAAARTLPRRAPAAF